MSSMAELVARQRRDLGDRHEYLRVTLTGWTESEEDGWTLFSRTEPTASVFTWQRKRRGMLRHLAALIRRYGEGNP